ncbi:TonB-dependent receptor domain-containing protein [Sphingobium sp. CAP-1]|uniref:TonB-dependent receptor domain-containing protein n=1 Tax=Sphingobium sp. CAP-1 TaxID=2676077 RepID=UPI001E459DF5|nr:TonB-dependent receptor [Sphingobium sp. CAP-1]
MTTMKTMLLIGTALLALPGPALAQDGDDATTRLSLDRLIISAGAEKVAIDTPQAVTALDQEDIDQSQATTIGDLLEAMPGVNVQGGVGQLGQGFNIRGMGTAMGDSDNRILLTVDGVTKFYEQYRMGAFFSEPELYKRVEVLRGPASSTLYGAGALAGVVNFTTKDASDFLSAGDRLALRLKAATETNAQAHTLSGIVAVQPVDGVELLGSYNYRRTDEYKDGHGDTVAASATQSDSYLVKARVVIGGNKKHAIWASYQDWLSDAPQVYDQISAATGNSLMRRRVHDKTAVLGYVNDFNGSKLFNLEAQIAYSLSKVHQTETTFLGANLEYSDFSYESWQAKVQNSSEFDLGGDWTTFLILGGQWSVQERRNPRVAFDGTVTPGSGTHPEGDMTRYGLFSQLEIIWSDKLTITPGVRVDWTDLKPGATVVGGTTLTDNVRNSGVSPKIAALYNLTPWFGLFGSVSHTVRMPNVDEIFTRSTTRPSNPDLKPEKSDNYEAGFTLSFDDVAGKGDRFRAKTTLFQNDVRDLIVNVSATSGTPYFQNINRSRFKGLEVEAEYGLGGFFARANASFIQGKNRLTGAYLNTIPANDYRLTLGYADAATGLSGGWTGEFAERQDKVTTTATSSAGSGLPTPGYTVHNLFFAFKPQSGAVRPRASNFASRSIISSTPIIAAISRRSRRRGRASNSPWRTASDRHGRGGLFLSDRGTGGGIAAGQCAADRGPAASGDRTVASPNRNARPDGPVPCLAQGHGGGGGGSACRDARRCGGAASLASADHDRTTPATGDDGRHGACSIPRQHHADCVDCRACTGRTRSRRGTVGTHAITRRAAACRHPAWRGGRTGRECTIRCQPQLCRQGPFLALRPSHLSPPGEDAA